MNLTSLKPQPPFLTVQEAKEKVCPHKIFDRAHAPCILCNGTGQIINCGTSKCPNCSGGKIPIKIFMRDYYNPIMREYAEQFNQWREQNNMFKRIWNKLNKEERNVLISIIKL